MFVALSLASLASNWSSRHQGYAMLCVSFLELLKGMHKGFCRVLTIRAILETSGPFLGSFLLGVQDCSRDLYADMHVYFVWNPRNPKALSRSPSKLYAPWFRE